ncbi:hypothetical protein FACHB389_28050 [Nostoc calcicola FACHB-389]|nr:hypothetical protein [Nostoc calcicola FACHB-3891]OKH28260.1 hypothetical protein FACHB389_28050 [Nostoc calcicola FACHB-389]
MANLTLSELYFSGSEFFQGEESFLSDLSDVDSIFGGDSSQFSDMSILTKLLEAYVNIYAIGQIAFIATSYSKQ